MQHGGGNRRVGGEEHQHGRHVGVDHAAALGDAAQTAGLSAQGEFHSNLLANGVGGHDALGGGSSALRGQPGNQLRQTRRDGVNGQGLTDDAGGGDDHVVGRNAQGFGCQGAHFLGNLDAVCVAGVGVAAVADYRLGNSVGKMLFRHGQGRALDQIGSIYRSGAAGHAAENQG